MNRLLDSFIHGILHHRKAVVTLFLVATIVCACMIPFVKTNYDMVDYLPESAQSTTAVAIMGEEFTQGIPNANIMVRDITLAEARDIKQDILDVPGVESVLWLDDVTDLAVPLETTDPAMVEQYWHAANDGGTTGTALFQASVTEGEEGKTVPALRELIDGIGPGNAVSGDAADTAQMQASTVEEVLGAVLIIVPIILFLLIVSTLSWIEPVLFVAAIGVSIVINMGTNIALGQVSFITYSVSPILQLAVSLDYAIFLLHSFAAHRQKMVDPEAAMAAAMRASMPTIAASATTTLFGFAALAFMQFEIGADLGLNLVKGIVFSFVTVAIFLPALTMMLWRLIDKTAHRSFMPNFSRIDRVLSKIRIPALVLVLALVVPAFLGQANTTFTYQNNSPDPEIRGGADMLAVQEEFGQNNAIAILVPRGDKAKEAELSNALLELDNVKSVVSYASMVGAAIPEEYLDKAVLSQFYSDAHARIVAYVDTDVESDEAFATVEAVEDTAAQFYDEYYAAGQSANLYDMKQIVSVDNVVVSLVAVVAIFFVLLVTFRSLALPLVLLLAIESGIWINLAIPYFTGTSINFIGYLVINTVQLGATIDYAILLTSHYMEHRKTTSARSAAYMALGETFPSLLVSAGILATAGFALAATSSLSAVASLGLLLGRGAILSLTLVTCFLPALLILLDGAIRRTTWKAGFFVPIAAGSERGAAIPQGLNAGAAFGHVESTPAPSDSPSTHEGQSALVHEQRTLSKGGQR